MYRICIALFLALVFLPSSLLFAMFEEEDVDKARKQLSPYQRFVHFDLKLSATDREFLEKVSITKDSPAGYEIYDQLELLETKAHSFIKVIGEGANEPSLCSWFSTFINQTTRKILTAFEAETAWVSLRASTPNSEPYVPIWHKDVTLTARKNAEYIVMTLKGPGTLFCNPPEAMWKDLGALYKEQFASRPRDPIMRTKINDFLSQCSQEATPS